MWTYLQRSGKLLHNGNLTGVGYSGHGEGKNNPAMQSVHNVGPIPCGLYTMEKPIDTETHGPYVIPLKPDPSNQMFGRSGFLCHGDSKKEPGTASLGCMIQNNIVRHGMWESGDHQVLVMPDQNVAPDVTA